MTAAPCWVLRHPDGEPWEPRDDGSDAHYTEAEARQAIEDLIREQTEDALLPGEPQAGENLAADLRPVQLAAPCLTLACSVCEREPEGGEFAHIHFPDVASLDKYAETSGWRRVDGEWRCFDCPTADDEDEEDEPARPGPDDVPLPLEVTK